jgi:hypothetical protein
MLVVRRLRWLLFFSNSERSQIRQGLQRQRFGSDEVRDLLKELA